MSGFYPYADLHCDSLTRFSATDFLQTKHASVALDKLIEGDCFLQCFAVYMRAGEGKERFVERAAVFRRALPELERAGIRGVLTVENGGFTCGDAALLDLLAAAGVRIFGLVWNDENALAYPHGSPHGLKKAGRRAVESVCEKGIFPDVSHLSDAGAEETLEIARSCGVPVLATHSLSRAVCPHSRNLPDGLIKKIADGGGLIGVNFVREFVGKRGIAAHVRRIVEAGGEDVVALGTDFDGTENPLYAGADETPRFFDDLLRAGISPRVAEKLASGNVKRLFDRCVSDHAKKDRRSR